MKELEEPNRGLWTFHQDLSVMGAEIGCRMTVVRVGDGTLLLHSPIRLTPPIQERLGQLGRVGHVLAPNFDHYFFVTDYQARYPEARFYAAPGVAANLPAVRFDVVLSHPGTIATLDDSVTQHYFRSSPMLQELVLFHRATRTLITADLAFNIQKTGGALSGVLLRLNDSYKSFRPSRICRSHITEPSWARADVDSLLALQPERIIVSHGEILTAGGTEALRQAYVWLT